MRAPQGVVRRTKACVENGRLVVRLCLMADDGPELEAFLPDRELSALLPRSLLVGPLCAAPQQLLGTIGPILDRLVRGRAVRTWEFHNRSYASFLSWRSVRFRD